MKYSTNVPKSYDKFPVFNSSGHVIGEIRGNTLYKKVKSSVHMLLMPKAWAIDEDAIDFAVSKGTTDIEVSDKESGSVYRCSIQTFVRYGVKINRGFGQQIALPLSYWSIITPIVKGQLSLWA